MTRICEACGQQHKVKEPNALGTARYDPLIDIAYEIVQKHPLRGSNYPHSMGLIDQAHRRIEMAGGMAHVQAMRSRVAL